MKGTLSTFSAHTLGPPILYKGAACEFWLKTHGEIKSRVKQVLVILLDSPLLNYPDAWIRLCLLTLCESVNHISDPTTDNWMHVKYLVLDCARVICALEAVVNEVPDPVNGMGGMLLPWISPGICGYPVVYGRVDPANSVLAARTTWLRVQRLDAARVDLERRAQRPRQHNARDTLDFAHWFGAFINPAEGRWVGSACGGNAIGPVTACTLIGEYANRASTTSSGVEVRCSSSLLTLQDSVDVARMSFARS